jgi:hypothetical protein
VVDRVLSSGTGQIRLQIDRFTHHGHAARSDESSQRHRATSGLLRDTHVNELTLEATERVQTYRGNIELPINTAMRLQVVLDNDEASTFVTTLPPLS